MRKLDTLFIKTQTNMKNAKEHVKEFFKSEKGVSPLVATIIILLLVVLIAGVFWEQLKTWLDGMMDQIFGTSFDYDK